MCKVLIDFIRQEGLERLKDRFGIHIKRHSEFNNLVLLKYDQLNSPHDHPIVQKCRGIILDEADDWRVVLYPYNRFFNYGESNAATINWSTARVYEKLDGSLMTLYYYSGQWRVASSGLPDAGGKVMGTTTTFRELFWKVWDDLGYKLPSDTECCYMFEMCTPNNRVVVRHTDSRIVLHGARRLSDFRELNPVVEAFRYGWECVKIYPLKSWNNVLEASKALDPMKFEGYVVCDTNYNRVKVKSPQYVAIAHMKEGFSIRRMLEIVRTRENSEFLSYYPEYTDLYYDIRSKYEHQVGFIEGFYEAIKGIDDRKKFALIAKEQKFSGILFGLKFGKLSNVKAGLVDMDIKNLESWLGLKSTEL